MKLAYLGQIITENHNGLMVNTRVALAIGTAERVAAIEMLEQLPGGSKRVTPGADRAYDTADFVEPMRELRMTPPVAHNDGNPRRAIDARATGQLGHAAGQRKRRRVEEVFGRRKTIALPGKTRFRGPDKAGWMFTLGVAGYRLIRMRNLGRRLPKSLPAADSQPLRGLPSVR